MTITSHGAVHHCHHYYRGADSCADCQWTDLTAGEFTMFPCKQAWTIKPSAKRSQVTNRYPELKQQIPDPDLTFLIITCLRMYCPALPADTGHSDGCAAANRGASGDGLRPAGADTPGSGVNAALCQCHDSVAATTRLHAYNQNCFFMTHLCCLVHPPSP